MALKRLDVWSFADPWHPAIDWYEKAVADLLKLPIENPLSWRSLGAMHGIHQGAWVAHGYLTQGQVLPNLGTTLWNQCQHQSWYFLPWHRGYLHRFEAIIRDTIIRLGGPSNWTLPYWNYNGKRPHSIELPTAFRSPTRLDGAPNHLFVRARFGTDGKGHVKIDPARIGLNALKEGDFDDDLTGGFAGPKTVFNLDGELNGQLENLPHNAVHGFVGGQSVSQPTQWTQVGLMSTPQTAALDPIFWLHHANIDRLWEIWLNRDKDNKNPTGDDDWMKGPPATGRKFLLPDVDGQIRQVQAGDIASAQALGYEYDDITDPIPSTPGQPGAQPSGTLLGNVLSVIMPAKAQEFASSADRLFLGSEAGEARVRIDAQSKPKGGGLQGAGILQAPAPRVYLRLDGIQAAPDKGISDAAVIDVYVAAPAVAGEAGVEHFVGSVSMFGSTRASDPSAPHGGAGITQALDITDSYQALQRAGGLDADELTVKFRKATDIGDLSNISVGKVRLIHKP